MNTIEHYRDETGRVPFQTWLDSLRDKQAKARIAFRLAKLAAGTFGDCKPCREGVWELREDLGPGYRVYYAATGKRWCCCCAAETSAARAADISRAVECWKDYQRRSAP